MTQHGFTISGRLRSIRCAINGIAAMLRSQPNARIHALATLVVCSASVAFGISRWEWCWVVVAVVGVWTAEALNTALEYSMDMVSPNFRPGVGRAKDIAAGAVLISAAGSVVIGLLILGPYVLELLRG